MRLLVDLPAPGRLVLDIVVLALDDEVDRVRDLDRHLMNCYLQEQLLGILIIVAFQA